MRRITAFPERRTWSVLGYRTLDNRAAVGGVPRLRDLVLLVWIPTDNGEETVKNVDRRKSKIMAWADKRAVSEKHLVRGKTKTMDNKHSRGR